MQTYTDTVTGYTYDRGELLDLASDVDVHQCGIRHEPRAIGCEDRVLHAAVAAQFRACQALELDPDDVLGPRARDLEFWDHLSRWRRA